MKLTLLVGRHIPSFKNKKRAIQDRKTGKMRTLTDPATKRRMEEIIRGFVYQFCCATQTITDGTLTEEQAHSLIALSLPADDSWQWVPELHVSAQRVIKGQEGAEITIEAL